jgi:predicted molibdopterin-dependent oxidoreductase YjgC
MDGHEPESAGATRVADHPLLGPLPAAAGVAFAFDGRALLGRAGEPLLAALFANGVRVVRTMPASGEPRGGWCLVGRCADCLVVVDGVPNVRACLEPVREGMRVERQHGLAEDADLAAPFGLAPDDDR